MPKKSKKTTSKKTKTRKQKSWGQLHREHAEISLEEALATTPDGRITEEDWGALKRNYKKLKANYNAGAFGMPSWFHRLRKNDDPKSRAAIFRSALKAGTIRRLPPVYMINCKATTSRKKALFEKEMQRLMKLGYSKGEARMMSFFEPLFTQKYGIESIPGGGKARYLRPAQASYAFLNSLGDGSDDEDSPNIA